MHRALGLISAVIVALSCTISSSFAQGVPTDKIEVVASISILADFVTQVGGARVTVTSLVGPDSDAHVFSPSPADAAMLSRARLVVVNGLGLEGWMDRLVRASGTHASIVVATKGIKPLNRKDEGKTTVDPHAWQSVANAKIYVANIRDGLIAVDPAGKDTYVANTVAYLARLDALEAEVRATIEKIPADRRKIITTHDAFGYFAAAYGMAFIAPLGVSTESGISARDVVRIIRQIRAQSIPAVFLETISDRRLIDQIARETGAKIGGALYSDALSGPDGPAPTYIDMIRHNIRQFALALAN